MKKFEKREWIKKGIAQERERVLEKIKNTLIGVGAVSAVRTALEKLRTEIEKGAKGRQCAAGPWRPIKDAPFDTEILIWRPGNHYFVAIHYPGINSNEKIAERWWGGDGQAWSDEAFPGKFFAETNQPEEEGK